MFKIAFIWANSSAACTLSFLHFLQVISVFVQSTHSLKDMVSAHTASPDQGALQCFWEYGTGLVK